MNARPQAVHQAPRVRQRSAADELDRALDALHTLDPGAPREQWVRAGMAAKAAGLGFEDWHRWSEGAGNYQGEADCRSVWRSIRDDGGIGPATLFGMARDAGWRDDQAGRREMPVRPTRKAVEARAGHPKADHRPRFDVAAVWASCTPATPDHPYVDRKLGLHAGLRVVPADSDLSIAGASIAGWLAVPMFEPGASEPASIQFIGSNRKLTAPGPMRGWLTVGGSITEGSTVYVCEGIGQGWSAHQATRSPAVVAFGIGRFETVAKGLRERFPGARLVLVPDVGQESKAEAVATAIGCAWVELPADLGRNGDVNDLHQRDGLEVAADALAQTHEAEVDDWPGSGDVLEFLSTSPPPIQWFIRERLLADRAHLLTGIGGSSKTRTLLHLGIGAVLGRLPWDWTIERTGSAALLLSEDTRGGTHRALHAMRAAMDMTPAEVQTLSERLRVWPVAGQNSRLLTAAPGGTLADSDRVDRLMEAIRKLPPPVVFIALDPALGLTEGDEMSPAHQRRMGELADRIAIETGACVVLASHAAKALQAAEEIGSHSSRGSGALTDAVRGEFVLRTMTAAEARAFGITEIEERKAYVQLVATKGNELPPSAFAPIWLRRSAGGLLVPAELAVQEQQAIGRRELDALAVLKRLATVGVPKWKDWRDCCVAEKIVVSPTQPGREKTMQRIRSALLSEGLVEPGMSRGVFVPTSNQDNDTNPFKTQDTP